MLHNVERREGLDESLKPALEVWAMAQSVPEPGLAILSCGKRDISFDLSLPVLAGYAPRGERSRRSAPADWTISALNDQHAYLRFDPAGTVVPAVRSEEHTSELPSLMRLSYAVFCLKKKQKNTLR